MKDKAVLGECFHLVGLQGKGDCMAGRLRMRAIHAIRSSVSQKNQGN